MRTSVAQRRIRRYNWLLAVWLANPVLGAWSAPEPVPAPSRGRDDAAAQASAAPLRDRLKNEWSRSTPRSSRTLLQLDAGDWFATLDLEDDVALDPLHAGTTSHGPGSGHRAGPIVGPLLDRRDAPRPLHDRVAPLRC